MDAVKTSGANLVAMSALLTTTMANMPATIAGFLTRLEYAIRSKL